jgi:type IV pilus assembly protein PilB
MAQVYLTTCWNCLGEYDALSAVWCADNPKNPTKLCPFCFRCFCTSSETFKEEFWQGAPPRLHEELQMLSKSKDRLGDILIRMGKLTTTQLLDALVGQKNTGKRLGDVLVEKQLATPEDIALALKTQGVSPLSDTQGVAFAASPVWERSGADDIIQYLLSLATRKGASDIQIEPKEDAIGVRYRIDGSYFRVDPIPKTSQAALVERLCEVFHLEPSASHRPQGSRTAMVLGDIEYDVIVQMLPTGHGPSATIKLVNRATFIKDFATLGLELEDRVRLMEELRASFGLILLSSPVFNGAFTTGYAVMNFLVHGQRDAVSLESPIHWVMDGVRQVEVNGSGSFAAMEETLRSAMAVRPEVLLLFGIPDHGTAQLATQLASSVLVIAVLPAPSAAQAISAFIDLGAPAHGVSTTLVAVSSQRLLRKICTICKEPVEPPPAQTLALHGIGAEEAASMRFFRGKGCPKCNRVGYRGRQAVFEVLTAAPEVRSAVAGRLSAEEVESMAVGAGMETLRSRALALVREGATTFEEFVKLRF